LTGGSVILASNLRARLAGVYDLVEFSQRGQRVAECNAFRNHPPVFALVIHQNVETVSDCKFCALDALSQPHSVGFEQRNVKEFAPVSGIVCGHNLPPRMKGPIAREFMSNYRIGYAFVRQWTIASLRILFLESWSWAPT